VLHLLVVEYLVPDRGPQRHGVILLHRGTIQHFDALTVATSDSSSPASSRGRRHLRVRRRKRQSVAEPLAEGVLSLLFHA
jgi:hypothetical protein